MSMIKLLMSTNGAMVVLMLAGVTMAGCAKDHVYTESRSVEAERKIIDEPTPRGRVDPQVAPTSPQPYRPYGTEPVASAAGRERSIDEVKRAYVAKHGGSGAPRIALFVNRTLDDDPREWESSIRFSEGFGRTVTKTDGGSSTTKRKDRTVTKTDGENITTKRIEKTVTETDGERITTKQKAGAKTASIETRNTRSGRQPIDQAWAWQLEDAIKRHMIDANASIIERAVIVRLAAADTPHTAYEDIPLKTIEVDALRGHADILVEFELLLQPGDGTNLAVRMQAFEVKTGRVVASSSTLSWPRTRGGQGQLVATPGGFERSAMPSAENLGMWFAHDLIVALTG